MAPAPAGSSLTAHSCHSWLLPQLSNKLSLSSEWMTGWEGKPKHGEEESQSVGWIFVRKSKLQLRPYWPMRKLDSDWSKVSPRIMIKNFFQRGETVITLLILRLKAPQSRIFKRWVIDLLLATGLLDHKLIVGQPIHCSLPKMSPLQLWPLSW